MIHQPKLKRGPFGNVELVNRLAGLHQAQKMKSAIQRADLTVGGDHCDGLFLNTRRSNDETFIAHSAQIGGPISNRE